MGRVARYAWTRDYHLVLGEALKALEETARGLGLKAKGYVDHGPLPERTLAALSGAGWIGKSGYFLSQAFGVHAFIGVLLTPWRWRPPPSTLAAAAAAPAAFPPAPRKPSSGTAPWTPVPA